MQTFAGDDTSCRVLEVSRHRTRVKAGETRAPPWAPYHDREAAKESIALAAKNKKDRERRRADGDREARPTRDETPTIGMLVAEQLGFEFAQKAGDGPKTALHVSVLSGRSVAEDPRSLIVFYRSHLGSFGNLLETLLERRDAAKREIIIQSDMSTTNLVKPPSHLEPAVIKQVGCLSHARSPFAKNLEQDPENCEYMLDLMIGLFMHESQLDEIGRNRENVAAVRNNHSRPLWDTIEALAKEMTDKWSASTTLGGAARYIINHLEALKAHLDDPRLELTNNLRERLLRLEKLIEGSSMFRKSLEGRFVLDIVRSILQSAVASGASPHEYLLSVLKTRPADIKAQPGLYTPYAWALRNPRKDDSNDNAEQPAV